MADRLARIFGTEEDKVNCPFYFKIGACRHGDTCTRLHNKPILSQTLLFFHLYDNPPAAVAFADGMEVNENMLEDAVKHFEDFYEDIFLEMIKYGEVEEIHVCDNIGDHIIGNCYIKYSTEEEAKRCMEHLNGKYYAGRIIYGEYCPVTDFREAKCRQYSDGSCERGGYCNFMHLKHVPKSFRKALFRYMYEAYPEYKERKELKEKQEKHERRERSYERDEQDDRANKPRRESSRSKSKDRYDSRARGSAEVNAAAPRQQTSEERRAMIAQWNVDDGL